MGKYDAIAATARSLIERFGEVSTIVRRTPSPEDPALPWEPPGMAAVETDVPAVWTKDSLIRKESVALDAEAFAIVPSDFEPDPATDSIRRADGRKYQIISVEAIDPDGQKIIYELAVKV